MSASKRERKQFRRDVMENRRAVRDANEARGSLWGPSSSPRVQRARSQWTERGYQPEYLRLALLAAMGALLGAGVLALGPPSLVSAVDPLLLLFGAVAFFAGAELLRYFGEPVVPPDVNAFEFRRRLLRRRLRAGVPGIVALVGALGLASWLRGPAGFAVVEALWAAGMAVASIVYSAVGRVRYCAHCRYFVTFRRFEGRWACTTCGRPLAEGAASAGPT